MPLKTASMHTSEVQHHESWGGSLACFGGRGLSMSRNLLSASKTSITTLAFSGNPAVFCQMSGTGCLMGETPSPYDVLAEGTHCCPHGGPAPVGAGASRSKHCGPSFSMQEGPSSLAREGACRGKWINAPL